MTRAEARRVALSDAALILAEVAYDGRGGMAPSFAANRFFSENEKDKISQEFDKVISSLYRRVERADRQVEREFQQTR